MRLQSRRQDLTVHIHAHAVVQYSLASRAPLKALSLIYLDTCTVPGISDHDAITFIFNIVHVHTLRK